MRPSNFNPYDPNAQAWALDVLGDKPWEQLPNENRKAYSAFQVFCAMNPNDRTVLATYRTITGSTKAVSRRFNDWVRDFHWQARAAFWDKFRDDTSKEAELKKIRELGEQRATAYLTMMRSAMVIIQKADLANLTPDQARGFMGLIPTLIDTGARGNRLETGEPGDRVQLDVVSKRKAKGRYADQGNETNENVLTLEALHAIAGSGKFELPPDTSGRSLLGKA